MNYPLTSAPDHGSVEQELSIWYQSLHPGEIFPPPTNQRTSQFVHNIAMEVKSFTKQRMFDAMHQMIKD
jgi:hypothetical protein